mmetsp:Transcript_2217/g.6296  ORF Transcript_2217/g.6296 Transcript_2217/m.6296 type:complete len:206 (-) Transcript_2217:639-1256(-)
MPVTVSPRGPAPMARGLPAVASAFPSAALHVLGPRPPAADSPTPPPPCDAAVRGDGGSSRAARQRSPGATGRTRRRTGGGTVSPPSSGRPHHRCGPPSSFGPGVASAAQPEAPPIRPSSTMVGVDVPPLCAPVRGQRRACRPPPAPSSTTAQRPGPLHSRLAPARPRARKSGGARSRQAPAARAKLPLVPLPEPAAPPSPPSQIS